MTATITITMPEEVKEKGKKRAKEVYKNFSCYVKDLILEDIRKDN